MNLLNCYLAAVQRGEINDDPSQREILTHMQRLANDLSKSKPSWFNCWRKPIIKGLYIYGTVGVGKTYLVDLFYQYIAEKNKVRFHFHHFMQQIDMQLREVQGHKDPLLLIAKDIAKSTRLICFDEFLVHDVAYAMILAELLQALIRQGIVLVVSSNTKPDDLYLNGAQRARFLPAIALLKKNCDVLNLDVKKDYRLGREPLLDAYLYPLNEHTERAMESQFVLLAKEVDENGVIRIQNRDIPFVKCSARTIWFNFDVLCNLPRSQLDYLEIAEEFDAIFISNIPALTEKHTAQAIMLIYFIDVMYDRGIKVIISAAVPAQDLYLIGEMKDSFQRTLSRLLEMQSVDYLRRHPRRIVQDIRHNLT